MKNATETNETQNGSPVAASTENATMKTQLESLVEKVNEEHYQNDYKRAVLVDTTLRRNLTERAKAAGLDISKLVMGEYGPCGSFAYRVANSPAKEVTITESEHAALVAVAEAAKPVFGNAGNYPQDLIKLGNALTALDAVRKRLSPAA